MNTWSCCAEIGCWITTVKWDFTASNNSDLTNFYGLSQASHPEVAEHNVLWCAILSPPPSDFHGSQSLQSIGIYPPAQLLCVRLIPSIWFTGVCETGKLKKKKPLSQGDKDTKEIAQQSHQSKQHEWDSVDEDRSGIEGCNNKAGQWHEDKWQSNCLVEPSVAIQSVCQQPMQMDTRHWRSKYLFM